MNTRLAVLLLLILTSLLSAAGYGRELRVLSHPFPPWHDIDPVTGKVSGIAVDISRQIFQQLGITVRYQQQTTEQALQTIARGEAEAILSISRKKPRNRYLDYPAEDIWRSEYVFFVHRQQKNEDLKGSYWDIKAGEQLVRIVNDWSYNYSFWAAFPYRDGSSQYSPGRRDYHPLLRNQLTPEQSFSELLNSKQGGVIIDKIMGISILGRMPNRDEITHYDEVLFSKGYPMPFAKHSPYPALAIIARRFEQELVAMKADGRYQLIVDKWLSRQALPVMTAQ